MRVLLVAEAPPPEERRAMVARRIPMLERQAQPLNITMQGLQTQEISQPR